MIADLFIPILLTAAAAYALLCVYAWLRGDKILFREAAPTYAMESAHLRLQRPHGEAVVALHLRALGASHTLLHFHGNGEDLEYCRPFMERYRARGVDVFAIDYPGYGRSPGPPSERATLESAEAAYRHLTEDLGVAAASIVVYGRSLGSGPAIWLASRFEIKGLIIDGGFSSAFRVKTRIRLLPWDRFDNLTRIRAVRCKTLLIHGTDDRTVPFRQARQLLAACGSDDKALLTLEDTGHHNIIDSAGAAYWDAVRPFFD